MDYKHSCVIDAQNLYKTFVLVLLAENEEGQQEEKIQYYTLQDGEQLVDTAPPVMRPYAGAAGFISPKWDADAAAWVEAASAEEIAAWEAEHPAPEAPAPEVPEPEPEPEPSGDSATKSDVQAVWDQMAAAIREGVDSV